MRLTRRAALAATGGLVALGGCVQRHDPDPFRFAVASDGHYGGFSDDRDYEDKHDEMMEALNGEDVEAVFFNGDNICHPMEGSGEALAELRDEYYERLDVPYEATHGNHDGVDDSTWESVLGSPKNQVVTYRNAGFVLLDSYDTVGEAEMNPNLEFLKGALEEVADREHVFVLSHYWFSEELDGKLSGAGSADHFSEEALDLIHGAENVVAVIHGHNHGQTAEKVYYLEHNDVELPYVMSGIFGGYVGDCREGYRVFEAESRDTLGGTVETKYKELASGDVLNEDVLDDWRINL